MKDFEEGRGQNIELQSSRLLRAATIVVVAFGFVLAVIAAIGAGTANGGQTASSQKVLSLISKALSNKPPLSGPGQSSNETHSRQSPLILHVQKSEEIQQIYRTAHSLLKFHSI